MILEEAHLRPTIDEILTALGSTTNTVNPRRTVEKIMRLTKDCWKLKIEKERLNKISASARDEIACEAQKENPTAMFLLGRLYQVSYEEEEEVDEWQDEEMEEEEQKDKEEQEEQKEKNEFEKEEEKKKKENELANAKMWFEKAAAAGCPNAYYNLWQLCEDESIGLTHLRKGVDLNEPRCILKLGSYFAFGYSGVK